MNPAASTAASSGRTWMRTRSSAAPLHWAVSRQLTTALSWERRHRTRIQAAAREALLSRWFRAPAATGISEVGSETTEPPHHTAPTPVHQEAADSCIRMMVKRAGIDTTARRRPTPLPKSRATITRRCANANSIPPADSAYVTALLVSAGVFSWAFSCSEALRRGSRRTVFECWRAESPSAPRAA